MQNIQLRKNNAQFLNPFLNTRETVLSSTRVHRDQMSSPAASKSSHSINRPSVQAALKVQAQNHRKFLTFINIKVNNIIQSNKDQIL